MERRSGGARVFCAELTCRPRAPGGIKENYIMLTGIPEIDPSILMSLTSNAIATGSNLMVFGPAGVGKTEIMEDVSTAAGYEYIYLNLSLLEAPDLLGILHVVNGRSSWAIPEKFPLFGTGKKKVLVVDEIDKAKPELQNPCLELFKERQINGTKLDIQAVLATGNLPDENAYSNTVSHALTNRCAVYRLKESYDAWQEWAVKNQVNALTVGFLSRNQHRLLWQEAAGDDTAYNKCSPRSWTNLGRDLDATKNQDVEWQFLLAAGRIGITAATEFRVWLEHYRVIEPIVDRLVNEGTRPSDSLSMDKVMVCAVSASAAVADLCRKVPKSSEEKAQNKARIGKVCKHVFGWLNTIDSEFCVSAVKSTLTFDEIKTANLVEVPEFLGVFEKIRQSMKRK